jgi:predicted outer membrane repeat protein
MCPFTIEGAGCPQIFSEYRVNQSALDIVCIPSPGGSSNKCVINCPLTQFVVSANASFTAETITFSGAIRAVVKVEAFGSFKAISSTFQNNIFGDKGGAISADNATLLEIVSCRFEGNEAAYGGAVYTDGDIVIEDSQFWNNRAIQNGGAVCAGSASNVSVARTTMGSNFAGYEGPAFFSSAKDADSQLSFVNNSGCENYVGSNPNITCNGVESSNTGCTTFEEKCSLPSASPATSNAPTNIPSIRPSDAPRVRPTRRPSVNPTAMPSKRPSNDRTASPEQTSKPVGTPELPFLTFAPISKTPTSQPSPAPSSLVPTLPPSPLPSKELIVTTAPTPTASQAPTATASQAPTATARQSAAPTLAPSVGIPSQEPSAGPTTTTPTRAPKPRPSTSPLVVPSARMPSQNRTFIPTTKAPAPSLISSTTPSKSPSSAPSIPSPSARMPSQNRTIIPTTKAPVPSPNSKPSKPPRSAPSTGMPRQAPRSAPTHIPAPDEIPTPIA